MTRTFRYLFVASATLIASAVTARAAHVTLVKDGKPLASIVVAKDALKAQPELKPDQLHVARSSATKIASAARDLQTYIHKISGAKLPIVGDEKEPEGLAILVGRNKWTKPFDKKIPDGMSADRTEEGLLILCRGNRLVLAGNDQPINGVAREVAKDYPKHVVTSNGYANRNTPPMGMKVPATAKGKPVKLYVPAIETEAWGWVNGSYVGHRPYREAYERPNEIDFDVADALKPGEKNVIVLRLHTGLGAAQQSAGMTSRTFLYSPKK